MWAFAAFVLFFAYNVSGLNGIYVVFQANFDFFMSTLYYIPKWY